MFIRWKHGRHRYTAYLVKSVRKDGKPCHEPIAKLCSITSWDAAGGLIGWAHLELKMPELHLSEDEQAHVYKLFAQKIPRPPDEMLERKKREIAALLAQIDSYEKTVVPDTPPMRTESVTTDEALSITWKSRNIPHNNIEYTASLVRQGCEPVKLGSLMEYDLTGKYDGRFWFAVHRALCLAKVDYATYGKTIQMLETWVNPPEDFINLIQRQLYYASYQVESEIKAAYRK